MNGFGLWVNRFFYGTSKDNAKITDAEISLFMRAGGIK